VVFICKSNRGFATSAFTYLRDGARCKSRLLFAKIAIAIWFQVSGFRRQAAPEGTIHHLRHTLQLPQLTDSGVLALGLFASMFSPTHSKTDINVL